MKIVSLILVLASFAVLVSGCAASKEPVSMDAIAREIENSIMCPLCPGQTIAESSSALSQQMRNLVREKVAQGATREEILQFFVERYGEGVLASPPKYGFNLLLWTIPFLGMGAGIFIVFWIIRSMRQKALSSKMSKVAISEQERQYWEQRLREDLNKRKR